MLYCLGTHKAKSMTEKIGGKTAGEVLCVGLCDCSTEQAVPVRWMGGLIFLMVALNSKSKNIQTIKGCLKKKRSF